METVAGLTGTITATEEATILKDMKVTEESVVETGKEQASPGVIYAGFITRIRKLFLERAG